MSIKKISPPWGGEQTPYDTTERNDGYASGQVPLRRKFNAKWNEWDTKVNSAVSDAINRGFADVASSEANYNSDEDEYQKALMTNQWPDTKNWGMSDFSDSKITSAVDLGELVRYPLEQGVCVAALATGTACEIYLYDIRTKAIISQSGDLSAIPGALDTSGSQVWESDSFTSDGDYFYMVFHETSGFGGSEQRVIQSFQYTESTDTWSLNSNWPTNGTVLGASLTNDRKTQVIVANDTYLAVSMGFYDPSSVNYAVRTVLISNGTIGSSGSGLTPAGAFASGDYFYSNIVSDGTHVYYTWYDLSVTRSVLSAVDIADATTYTGSWSANISVGSTEAESNQLLYLTNNRLLVFSSYSDFTIWGLPPDPDVIAMQTIRTDTTTGYCCDYYGGYYRDKGADVSNYLKYLPMRIARTLFDGVYFYVMGAVCIDDSPTRVWALGLTRFDTAALNFNPNTAEDLTMDFLNPKMHIVADGDMQFAQIVGTNFYGLMFDGRDLWCTDPESLALDKFIYRIPFAQKR